MLFYITNKETLRKSTYLEENEIEYYQYNNMDVTLIPTNK
jgi:seryl-tRNA synthetase